MARVISRRTDPVFQCAAACDRQTLGEIKGTLGQVLEHQKGLGAKVDALDGRIRHVENRSAIMGAAGALMVALGIEFSRFFMRKA